MIRVRVESFTISLDGYGTGPDQSVENPLDVGGEALHAGWLPLAVGGRCMERKVARLV